MHRSSKLARMQVCIFIVVAGGGGLAMVIVNWMICEYLACINMRISSMYHLIYAISLRLGGVDDR